MTARLTSSKLPLLQRCAWFAANLSAWTRDEPGPAAIFGSAVHRLAELAIDGHGRPPGALLGVVDLQAVGFELDAAAAAKLARVAVHLLAFLAANVRIGWTTEQPFAWDPITGAGRMLEKTARHREYKGLRPGEIGTTPDVVGWMPDQTTLLVLDLKSGANVGDPGKNWQLLAQAAAAADAFGADRVRIVVVYAHEDATTIEEATVDALDLETFREAVDLRMGWDLPEPTPGDWCGSYTSDGAYCPARASCPALARALAAVNDRAVEDVPPPFAFGPPTSPAHAAWILRHADLAGAALRAIEAELRRFADEHDGIPLPDGRIWKRHTYEATEPDLAHPQAAATLRALGFGAAIVEATSWSAIKELAGEPGEREARAALGKIRAVRTSPRVKYEAKALPPPPKTPKPKRTPKQLPTTNEALDEAHKDAT